MLARKKDVYSIGWTIYVLGVVVSVLQTSFIVYNIKKIKKG